MTELDTDLMVVGSNPLGGALISPAVGAARFAGVRQQRFVKEWIGHSWMSIEL